MSSHEEAHLRILKIVSAEPEISQRQLAARLGVSLGKTNFLIKALLEKGLIKAGNFRRAGAEQVPVRLSTDPKGIGEKVRMTRAYLNFAEKILVASHFPLPRFSPDGIIPGHSTATRFQPKRPIRARRPASC